jgi:hypothetical protein
MIRHLGVMPPRPGGGMWAGRPATAAAYDIATFGAAFIVQAPLDGETTGLTLSGADVLTYTDPISGLVASRLVPGGECTLDGTALVNGYQALRTSRLNSVLSTSSGGMAAGVRDHYILAAMAFPALTSAPSGLATCVSMGPMDGQSYCIGTEEGGPNTLYGFGAAQYSPFETRFRIVEMLYTAADGQRRVYVDGALDSFETGRTATVGAGGAMGLYGWFDGRTQDARVYTAVFRTSVPTFEQRTALIIHVGDQYAYQRPVQVAGFGDSITQGYMGIDDGAPVDCSTTDYLTELAALYAIDDKAITTYNRGVGGQLIEYHTPIGSTWPAGTYLPVGGGGTYGSNVSEHYAPLAADNVAVLIMGMNDATQYTAPATVDASVTAIDAGCMYDRLTATIHALQETGWKVLVYSLTPATGLSPNQSTQALVAAYRVLILANAAGAEGARDGSALSPWFCPDGIHPDDDSYVTLAFDVIDGIAAMGVTV